MERHGRGVPLRRLAMRKANVHDEGAIALAGCIFRAADAVAKHEAAVAEAARVRAKGEDGHRDARKPAAFPNIETASAGSVGSISAPT